MSEAPQIRVGIGGWVFPPWRGVFYPPGLPQAGELSYASRQLTTIEINGTFYGPQKPASFRRWHDETPEDFVFSIKGPRVATHRPDLAGAGSTLDRFFSSGVLELRDKLGPILWQFPPNRPADEGAFAAFIELLPERIEGRTVRHVVELRRPKISTERALDLLRRRRIALVADDSRLDFEITANFICAHLRRCTLDEPTGYSPDALDMWARLLLERSAQEACDCLVYFISGAKIRAPAAARALLQRLTSTE
jgi:uncharacterized protein YecE (DUF72 family)